MKMAKRNGLDSLTFRTDPFFLFPLIDEHLDTLFVDRDEQIKIIRGILKIHFNVTIEICAVIGGIGIGKSSMLNYIGRLAMENGFKVERLDNPDDYPIGRDSTRSETVAVLIDDVDKMDDEHAIKFYTKLGRNPPEGQMIFFTDTYERSPAAIHLRQYTISQHITLPQRLEKDRLKFFLEERMKRCLSKGSEFAFPIDEAAIEMASIRSRGNLRSFINYIKHGWMVASGGEMDRLGPNELRSGMISIDRALFAGCDAIDMRILWFSTVGDMNQAFLAHQSAIDSKTLVSRINGRLQDFIDIQKDGKEIFISSIYKHISGGQKILAEIIKGLGFRLPEITGSKE